jgi:hypothetical protein
MYYFLLVISVLYFVFAIYKTYTWIVAYKWVIVQQSSYRSEQDNHVLSPDVVLFIPALREQSLVDETIEYFNQMPYVYGKLHICFITTEKELLQKNEKLKMLNEWLGSKLKINALDELEKKNKGFFPRYMLPQVLDMIQQYNNDFDMLVMHMTDIDQSIPLTKDLIQERLEKIQVPNMNLLHYPETQGNKPEQLNYALNQLKNVLKDKNVNFDKAYIGVYDFDARPDYRTIYEIANHVSERNQAKKKEAFMFQQVQVPFSNLQDFNQKSERLLLRGFSTLYLRRVFGIELYKMRKVLKINATRLPSILKAILRPVSYGIGSGMFLHYNFLSRYGGFPSPLEDLASGYRVNMLGEDMVPLIVFNFMEGYDSYQQMSNSGSICFAGAMRIIKDYRIINGFDKKNNLKRIEKLSLVFKEWIESTFWLISVPLLITVFVLSCVFAEFLIVWLLALTFALRFFIDTVIFQQIIIKTCELYRGKELHGVNIGFSKGLFIVLTSPIQGLTRIMSPIKALIKLIKIKFLGIAITQTKTER